MDNKGNWIGSDSKCVTSFKMIIPGDIDQDGKVNIQNYNQLVTDFGRTGSPGFIPSDIDSSGKVDIFDYNLLVGNFGE